MVSVLSFISQGILPLTSHLTSVIITCRWLCVQTLRPLSINVSVPFIFIVIIEANRGVRPETKLDTSSRSTEEEFLFTLQRKQCIPVHAGWVGCDAFLLVRLAHTFPNLKRLVLRLMMLVYRYSPSIFKLIRSIICFLALRFSGGLLLAGKLCVRICPPGCLRDCCRRHEGAPRVSRATSQIYNGDFTPHHLMLVSQHFISVDIRISFS